MDLERPTMRPLALVTGASSGIGLELAKQLAMNGFDLLITARDRDLEAPRDILMDLGADVYMTHADLSRWSGVEKLHKEIQKMNRPLEAVILNAGVGSGGTFLETDLRKELELIRLNIMSSVHLTKLIIPEMVKAGSGRILFSSSISTESVYAASKAFLFSFSESLRNELKDTGVSVTALIPGAAAPEEVAKQGFLAMMKGKDHVIAGNFKTKMTGAAYKIIPEWAKAYVHRNLSAPGSAEEKAS